MTPNTLPLDPALIEPPTPVQDHLGYRMTGWSDGYARFELPFETFLGNRFGALHGGIHAVLCDTAMGMAGCFTGMPDDRRIAMTLSMNVNFLSQARGRLLIAEGFRTGGGARTFFAEARVTDDTGELCATSTGVFRIRGA